MAWGSRLINDRSKPLGARMLQGEQNKLARGAYHPSGFGAMKKDQCMDLNN
ncbi:hypothetical protein CDV31_000615 [Fusarium ambrosium]|uniref:Uncharacterized protein n=1 Tax=Fusarium ambrosium TaxID=131363 RepID=A0A428V2D5_9HYPO|nr:hypothetical protein CDV31_000615 [Fusarium ambrosium]